MLSGVWKTFEGRIASWASCAAELFFTLLPCFEYLEPKRSVINSAAWFCATGLIRVESVRI